MSEPAWRVALLQRLRRPPDAPPRARMTPAPEATLSRAESEVLELIARGYADAEIARLPDVSIHTVQTHIRNLYGKLAVHSRGETVFEASRMGLLGCLRSGSGA